MADEMLRIAGRGTDGLAKAIKTDNNGNISVFNGRGTKYNALFQTVAALSSYEFDLGLEGNESEVWILIQSGVQPWSAKVIGYPWSTGAEYAKALFPERTDVASTTVTAGTPFISFLSGLPPAFDESMNLGLPSSLEDAQKTSFYHTGLKLKFYNNHATDSAGITVKIIRVWK